MDMAAKTGKFFTNHPAVRKLIILIAIFIVVQVRYGLISSVLTFR